MIKLLVSGLKGFIGTRLAELLSASYEFEDLSRSSGIDITNFSQVNKKIATSQADIVIHLAAKTNVDECEKDKKKGKLGEAWRINVEGTRNVVKSVERLHKKIIFVSTDFVFDGKKTEGDSYIEDDVPSPLNWYAKTKYEGEQIVQSVSSNFLIVRLAYPYRSSFAKKGFVRAIIEQLSKKHSVDAVYDHIFTPTFVDDIVMGFDRLIKNNLDGVYHLVGSQFLTPYDATLKIKTVFDLPGTIKKTTRKEFFKGRAPRPFNLALSNGKISHLGISMKTFDEGLKTLKKQMQG